MHRLHPSGFLMPSNEWKWLSSVLLTSLISWLIAVTVRFTQGVHWVWANACKYRYRICKLVQRNFPGGSDGGKFACSVGELGSIPGWGRCPEGNATHSGVLACRIPGTEEPGGFKESDMTEQLTLFQASLSRFPNRLHLAASRMKFWIQITLLLIN